MTRTLRPHLQLFRDVGHGWRWHLKAGNGKIVATSGEAYSTRGKARAAARLVRALMADPDLCDDTAPRDD